MGHFSPAAWKGFGIFFLVLQKLHFTRPITWNPLTQSLKVNQKPQYLIWLISALCCCFACLGIPKFIFLEYVFVGQTSYRNITSSHIVVSCLMFLLGFQSLPVTLKLYTCGSDFNAGFNSCMRIERHLRSVNCKSKSNSGKLDVIAVFATFIGPLFLIFPLATFILVPFDIDIMSLVLSKKIRFTLFGFLLRTFITFVAINEAVTTIGLIYTTYFAAAINTKSLLHNLPFYKTKRLRGNQSSDRNLNRLQDTGVYQAHFISINVMRTYTDVATLFSITSGLAFGVVSNYTVLKMYGKLPLIYYLFVTVVAILVPVLCGALFPLAAQCYQDTEDIIHSWKSQERSRKTIKSKQVYALRSIGFSIGGFFVFNRDTIAGFFEQLSNYTTNAVLSF